MRLPFSRKGGSHSREAGCWFRDKRPDVQGRNRLQRSGEEEQGRRREDIPVCGRKFLIIDQIVKRNCLEKTRAMKKKSASDKTLGGGAGTKKGATNMGILCRKQEKIREEEDAYVSAKPPLLQNTHVCAGARGEGEEKKRKGGTKRSENQFQYVRKALGSKTITGPLIEKVPPGGAEQGKEKNAQAFFRSSLLLTGETDLGLQHPDSEIVPRPYRRKEESSR